MLCQPLNQPKHDCIHTAFFQWNYIMAPEIGSCSIQSDISSKANLGQSWSLCALVRAYILNTFGGLCDDDLAWS